MQIFYSIILGLLLVLSGGENAIAQKSPFGVPAGPQISAPAQPPSAITPRTQTPSVLHRAWVQVLTIQRDLHRQLAAAVRALKSDGGFAAAWLLASLSFIYEIGRASGRERVSSTV